MRVLESVVVLYLVYDIISRDAATEIKLWPDFEAYQSDILDRIYGEPMMRGSSIMVSLRQFEIKMLILKPIRSSGKPI